MNSQQQVNQLSALAQQSRLAVFRLLMTFGEAGLRAGDIAEKTGIARNTLSFHLKELQTAELIKSERQGRSIIYSLNISGYQSLITFLTEDCCKGGPLTTLSTPLQYANSCTNTSAICC